MNGGIEAVVTTLGEELAKMGHDVTIFAPKDSKVEGCHIIETSEPKTLAFTSWLQAENDSFDLLKDRLDEFDIISGHTWSGVEYRAKEVNPDMKVCHTHHSGLLADWWKDAKFKLNTIAVSNYMKSAYENKGIPTRVVYNGINIDKYKLQTNKTDRYIWLSRVCYYKAPHKAIEVAKRAGIKLDICGATTAFKEDAKFAEQIKVLCDGEQIRFIGEVSNEEKIERLGQSLGLLVTSAWGEPFGLHAVEAMATGTKVIALADGALPETIQEGGILCNDLDNMVEVIKKGVDINPLKCRKNALRFSSRIMAEKYVEIYGEIIAGREW